MSQDFPIGGPRKPVHDALSSRQFKPDWTDKHWTRLDGLEVFIYATGSRLLVRNGKRTLADMPMADSLAFIDNMKAELEAK